MSESTRTITLMAGETVTLTAEDGTKITEVAKPKRNYKKEMEWQRKKYYTFTFTTEREKGERLVSHLAERGTKPLQWFRDAMERELAERAIAAERAETPTTPLKPSKKEAEKAAREAMYEEAIRLHEQGVKRADIEKETGISRSTLQRQIAAHEEAKKMGRPRVVAADGRVTSGFRTPERPSHNGVDIAPKERGTNPRIVAYGDGVVRLMQRNNATAGNWLDIEHADGSHTTYMHLESIAPSIVEGHGVKRGETLGVMGDTGDTTGVHLHFEIRKKRERERGKNAMDPMRHIEI